MVNICNSSSGDMSSDILAVNKDGGGGGDACGAIWSFPGIMHL